MLKWIMLVIVKVNNETYSKMQSHISIGDYPNIETFVEIAIANQINLEERKSRIGESNQVSSKKQELILDTNNYRDNDRFGYTYKKDWTSLKPVEPVPLENVLSQHMPFCNRIFPAKIAIRVLANMLNSEDSFIDYFFFIEEASKIAQEIGLNLLKIDKKKRKKFRAGGAFSAGLPTGRKGDIIRAREFYIKNIIGELRNDGKVKGMLGALGLIGFSSQNQIGITSTGIRFAELNNPILDEKQEMGKYTLSTDEKEFYLNHIKNRLPNESYLIQSIIELINNGKRSHKEISLNLIGELDDKISSKSFASTISTIMGRMKELGLIEAERIGLSYQYKVII